MTVIGLGTTVLHRRVVTAVTVVTAGLVLTACGSSASPQPSPVSSTTPPVTTTVAPTSSAPVTSKAPTTSPTTSKPNTPTTTHKTALKTCSISVLTITDSDANEQHGTQDYGTIRARNTGTKSCTITGYPGIRLLINKQLRPSTLARAAGIQPHAVALSPNAVASFGFSHTTANLLGMCNDVNGVRVYDPDGSGYKVTQTVFRDCQRSDTLTITVGPFEAGPSASIAP